MQLNKLTSEMFFIAYHDIITLQLNALNWANKIVKSSELLTSNCNSPNN